MLRSLVVVVASFASAACLVPPLRAGAGGGAAIGRVASVDHSHHLEVNDHALVGELRGAVTPLELGETGPEDWDLSVGVVLDRIDAPYHRGLGLGPFVEAAWFTHAASAGHQGWRVGPTASIETLFDVPDASDPTVPGLGIGLTGGVLLEVVERVDGPIVYGGARGELGIGVALRGGVRMVDNNSYACAILSVEVRLPGMAGIPLPAPSKTRNLNY